MPATATRPGSTFYVAAACALAAGILGFFLVLTAKEYRGNAESIGRWYGAAAALSDYESALAGAESAHTGYLLSGSGEALGSLEAAYKRIDREQEALGRAFGHDSGAQPALTEVARIGDATVVGWQRSAAARDVQGGIAPTVAALASRVAPLDSLRDRIDRGLAAEKAHGQALGTRFLVLALLVPFMMLAGMAGFAGWGSPNRAPAGAWKGCWSARPSTTR